jgi:hypothetical protein
MHHNEEGVVHGLLAYAGLNVRENLHLSFV